MPDLGEIQSRGVALFERLLQAESRGNRVVSAATGQAFSWFNVDDADAAAGFSSRLAALVRSAADELDGLAAALDVAEQEAVAGDTAMVRQALSMFVTHNSSGRKLIKPRTVVGAPGLFVRSRQRQVGGPVQISHGGESPELDYWREDELANEHHEHWHQVYPFTGIPVRDFDAWVAETSLDDMVSILDALQPDTSWRQQLENSSPVSIAALFADLVGRGFDRQLPPHLRGLLNKANDRHGELFIYMHAQMLARYDAELLSNELARVEPFGPDAWPLPIPSGHHPIGLPFGRRRTAQTMPANAQDMLEALVAPIEDALALGRARGADGGDVELDPVLVGEMLEAAVPWTSVLDTNVYRGLHNTGHGILASLAEEQAGGVMNSTVVAIRDPIFWRWHKFIDNLAASWQDQQSPYLFDDQPDVVIRNAIPNDTVDPAPWASPDIVLVNTEALPAAEDPAEIGKALLGGDAWDTAPDAVAGAGAEAITDELTTMMVSRQTDAGVSQFLSHSPFGYYVRIENPDLQEKEVTVRVFLAPTEVAEDRRAWIEMDKFHTTLAPSSRNVLYRADTDSSVIKRPAERSPDEVTTPGSSAEESGYCDCGWPWTLLLPRGTTDGMPYRLIITCTDWQLDRVGEPAHCGSMSFCGAVDRYPDQRDMGYPFNRPFAQSIERTFAGMTGAGGRRLTIRRR